MHATLAAKGWGIERINKLRPVHVRPSAVTPYFYGYVRSDRRGGYKIDGAVGVLHRVFEDAWWRERAREKFPRHIFDPFCLSLHIGNIKQISDASYIRRENHVDRILVFCNALFCFLDCLPATEQEVRNAVLVQSMNSYDIERYILPPAVDPIAGMKFDQLRQFLFPVQEM